MTLVHPMWQDMPRIPSEGDVQGPPRTDAQVTSAGPSQCGGAVALLWALHLNQGELQHVATELGSYKQAHTSSHLASQATPASLKELASRAQTVRGSEPNNLESLSWDWVIGARDRSPNHFLKPPAGGDPMGRWAHVAHLVCTRLGPLVKTQPPDTLCQIVHEAHPKLRSVLGVNDSQYPYITSIKTAQLSYYKIISKTQNERLYSWEQSWSWLCLSWYKIYIIAVRK